LPVVLNSPIAPEESVPHILNISALNSRGGGIAAGPLARLLDERGYMVSLGSACSAKKPEPDPVLKAMGFPPAVQTSALRISFSWEHTLENVESLAQALKESIEIAKKIAQLS